MLNSHEYFKTIGRHLREVFKRKYLNIYINHISTTINASSKEDSIL
jgi:hypothetical protein